MIILEIYEVERHMEIRQYFCVCQSQMSILGRFVFSKLNLSEQVLNRPLPSLWPAPKGEEGSAVRMYLMAKRHHLKTQKSLLRKAGAEEESPNPSPVISTPSLTLWLV